MPDLGRPCPGQEVEVIQQPWAHPGEVVLSVPGAYGLWWTDGRERTVYSPFEVYGSHQSFCLSRSAIVRGESYVLYYKAGDLLFGNIHGMEKLSVPGTALFLKMEHSPVLQRFDIPSGQWTLEPGGRPSELTRFDRDEVV
jgi:hypothetical protein